MSDAVRYLEQFIAPPSRIFQGGLGLKRMQQLLELVGNPQEQIKIIHVAGTSGKGSTCYFLSSLLHHHGFKVGLTISPHIHNIRERMQINNVYISEAKFCVYVMKIIPSIEQMKKSTLGAPTYFEIMMALEFLYFKDEEVDYAVIETGLGGQFDASNTVLSRNKVCVITKIGFDHTKVLGNTLSKIAYQKAKIIQRNNMVVSVDQRIQVRRVIDDVAKEQSTQVMYVSKQDNFKHIRIEKDQVVFDFFGNTSFKHLILGNQASYQVENAGVALYAVLQLSKRDKFQTTDEKVRKALLQTIIPGRMEIVQIQDKQFIVDGAHNPQKMRAFLSSLVMKYPGQKFEFLLAFKKDKDISKMIKMIIPYAHKIIVTDFSVNDTMVNLSLEPQLVEKMLLAQNFTNYEVAFGSKNAIEKMIAETKSMGVITGSMYLTSAFLSHSHYYGG